MMADSSDGEAIAISIFTTILKRGIRKNNKKGRNEPLGLSHGFNDGHNTELSSPLLTSLLLPTLSNNTS